jgi:uncharacterized Zn finger protein (UPF0148 family)
MTSKYTLKECIKCTGPLTQKDDELVCEYCGARYELPEGYQRRKQEPAPSRPESRVPQSAPVTNKDGNNSRKKSPCGLIALISFGLIIGGGVLLLILSFVIRSFTPQLFSEMEEAVNTESDHQIESVVSDEEPTEHLPQVQPTNTAYIPEPTIDPYPILNLPFTDDFNDGLSPEWRIISGNPIISNGKLGSAKNKDFFIEIANGQLKNYTITTQLYSREENWGWGGYFSQVDFYFSPTLRLVLTSSDFNSTAHWFAFEGNEWEKILRTELPDAGNGDNFKIVVNGNIYSVFMNGQLGSELIYGSVREVGSPLIVRVEGDNIFLDYITIE